MASVSSMKVIFADDHPLMRDGIRGNLEQIDGVTIVAEAQNGSEALGLVDALQCDVLVLDLDMPGINGIEVTERVKKQSQI